MARLRCRQGPTHRDHSCWPFPAPKLEFTGMSLNERRQAANKNRVRPIVVRFRGGYCDVTDPYVITHLCDTGIAIADNPADYTAARALVLAAGGAAA
jgi:hypothetical protein